MILPPVAVLILAWLGFLAYKDKRRGLRFRFGEFIELFVMVMMWAGSAIFGAFLIYWLGQAAYDWFK